MANLQEGGRRLGAVGLIGLKISAGVAALALLLFALTFTDLSFHLPSLLAPEVVLLGLGGSVWLAIIGGVLLATGWVVKGFGMPKAADRDHGSTIPATER